MAETYKDIPGYEGYYQVSNLGNVRSVCRRIAFNNGRSRVYESKVLSPKDNGKGYKTVALFKEGKAKYHLIHRLVMLTFVGYSDKECDHINRDKEDNRLCNLQYLTREEHAKKDDFGLSTRFKKGHEGSKGSRHSQTHLTDQQVIQIYKLACEGTIIQKDIGLQFGITQASVARIKSGKCWGHLTQAL